MGARSQFRCEVCRYAVVVSGGTDGGREVFTTTILCEDCQKLCDIPTSWIENLTASDGGPDQKPRPKPKFRCPKNFKHRIHEWKAGGACPVCGGGMVNEGERVLWD